MAHIEGEITIKRPAEEVFDFVADERHEPLYNREMLKCELITSEPIGAGSRFRAVMSMRGKPVEMTTQFTTFERPRLLGSRSHLSSMDIEGKLTFEAVPEGTRMRWFWDLHPRSFLTLMSPLVTRMGRQLELKIWTGLKHYLEEQTIPVPQR